MPRYIGVEIKGTIGGQTSKPMRAIHSEGSRGFSHSPQARLAIPLAHRNNFGADLAEIWHRDRQALLQTFGARIRCSGSTSQPIRQPVMQKYLEKELATMTWSENWSAVSAASP